MPKTYLWESILVTFLCCVPMGVVGLFYAASVSTYYHRGDIKEAMRKSQSARTWTMWGLVLGLIYIAVLIVLIAVCMFISSQGVFKSRPDM